MTTPLQCIFKSDVDGVSFDLTQLMNKDTFGRSIPYFYNTSASPYCYGFGFCSNLDYYCSSSSSFSRDCASVQCVKNYGSYTQSSWRSLGVDPSQGIEITYSGNGLSLGSCGSQLLSTQTVFAISCAPQLSVPLVVDSLTLSGDGCTATYSIRSPAGCGIVSTTIIYPLGVGWIVFISVICLISAYLGFGMMYNRYRYGSKGLESVPNISFWRNLFSCCGRGQYAKAGIDVDAEYADIDDPTI